ncbi:MAG TPA: amidase [Pseudorhodoplanes sp.]|nr:amidase [Pseudorhodoplanes sp.]
MSNHSRFMPALELASAIRRRELSAIAATAQIVDGIRTTQSTLNAYITVDADGAMQRAEEADAAVIRGGDLPPLHGVPVSVKDVINTAGLKTTYGSLTMADNVPDADAVAVERLKKAGANIVGKTTTSEFGHKLLTDAPLFGTTRNPWNLKLTPGGSSGGSAVAVAAGLGPLSLATDAGASTRLPAALTGIVGLKPTLGVIPHNQVPDAFNNYIHLGVMARTVADAALMLDVVAGEHYSDPHSIGVGPPRALAAVQEAAGKRRAVRAAWRPLVGNQLLDDDVRKICEQALAVFREIGWKIDTIDEPIENAEPAWRILQQANWAARFYARLDELGARLDPSFVEGIKAGGQYTGQQLLQATHKRTAHFRSVQSWFAKHDFVLTPTCSRPPLSVEHRALEPIQVNGEDAGDMRKSWVPYLNLFNLTGHPAVSIPCGLSAGGLPIGLQIVGRWYGDADVLRAAAAYEHVTQFHVHVRPAHAASRNLSAKIA